MKSPVEAPSGFTEITLDILCEIESVVTTIYSALNVTEHGVDPGNAIDAACLTAFWT